MQILHGRRVLRKNLEGKRKQDRKEEETKPECLASASSHGELWSISLIHHPDYPPSSSSDSTYFWWCRRLAYCSDLFPRSRIPWFACPYQDSYFLYSQTTVRVPDAPVGHLAAKHISSFPSLCSSSPTSPK